MGLFADKRANILGLVATAAAALSGCNKEDPAPPKPIPWQQTVGRELGKTSAQIEPRSVEEEADALKAALTQDGVIRFSPGMAQVHANCFGVDSNQPIASHWRAAGGELTVPQHEVLLLQAYLLAHGKLGDNSPEQLDGVYGEATRAGVEWLQSTYGERVEVKGHYGVTFSCRSVAQAILLSHQKGLFSDSPEIDGAPKIAFTNEHFQTRLLGGNELINGEPAKVSGLVGFAYIIVGRREFPDRISPNNFSSIARSVQDALAYVGAFGDLPRSSAVDGAWGPISESANSIYEGAERTSNDPEPDGVIGATTARRLFHDVLNLAASGNN